MAKIRIDMFAAGEPDTTFIIPLWFARVASSTWLKIAGKDALDGIDIDELLKAAEDPQANGVLLEIEDHGDNEKITISILRS